ncbi:hypothetical protein MFIFM68171_02358 [Madurella fahalii]|uniref:Tim44-like domain-containing protein n=1 Tax=Madurella fahalii TaxID=1157608 RepID=A0ABQ0G310_9PEZI
MASTRLGLRARGVLSTRVTGPTRIAVAPFSTSQIRSRGNGLRAQLEASSPRLSSSPSPKVQMAQRTQTNRSEISAEAISVLLPGTFVLPRLSEFPKEPRKALKLLYAWLVAKFQEVGANMATKYTSKPSFFKGARFKARRPAIVLAAKALHRSLAEALAAGDKDTISKICSRKLAGPMLASIDARPKTRRYGWELVSYTNKAFYPTIKAHRLAAISRERGAPLIRQAVVAISSRQRRVEYDAQGQVVPGSEKEMEVVENVALGCMIDQQTWQSDDWRIIGTVKSSSLEDWEVEKKMLETLMRET